MDTTPKVIVIDFLPLREWDGFVPESSKAILVHEDDPIEGRDEPYVYFLKAA